MEVYRICPICGNDSNITLLYKQAFLIPLDYEGMPEEYDIVECSNCGFVYDNMLASQAVYDNFYRRNSKYENLNSSTNGGISKNDIIRGSFSNRVAEMGLGEP